MSQFPQMLYREDEEGHVKLDGRTFTTVTVADEEEQEIAAADGYVTADEALKADEPAPKKRGRARKRKVENDGPEEI